MKRIFKKGLVSVLWLILIISLFVTGCGKETNTSSNDTEDPSSMKATITYWCNQDWADQNKQLVDDFQREYPNIKVVMTPFTYDALSEKLRAAYAAKKESDVQQIFGDWAIDLMKNGLIDEVPSDLAEDIRNRFYEAPLDGYSYNGKLYGVPKEFNIESGGVLYYPDELKRIGYNEFPKTFDELMNAAKKLSKQDSKGNVTHFGFDFISTDNVPYFFLSLILQQGGDYWNDDRVHVKFTIPEAEKALQTMKDMVVKDKITEVNHLYDMNNESQVMFFKKLSSMCYRGPWVIPAGLDDFGVTDFEYGPMPSFTGDSKAFATEPGWGEVVSSRSKNKEAAWLFVKYITSKEKNLQFNIASYTVPVDKAVCESSEYIDALPMMKTSLDILQYGKPIGPMQSMDTFKNIIGDNFTKVCTGSEDVKAALKNIENEINRMIDERLAQ